VCSAAERMLDCGCVDDHHARASSRARRSTLSRPMPAAAHHDHVSRCVEDRSGHVGGRADDQRVGAGDDGEQLVGREPEADVDVMAGLTEAVEATLRDLLGDEHSCHGGQCRRRLIRSGKATCAQVGPHADDQGRGTRSRPPITAPHPHRTRPRPRGRGRCRRGKHLCDVHDQRVGHPGRRHVIHADAVGPGRRRHEPPDAGRCGHRPRRHHAARARPHQRPAPTTSRRSRSRPRPARRRSSTPTRRTACSSSSTSARSPGPRPARRPRSPTRAAVRRRPCSPPGR